MFKGFGRASCVALAGLTLLAISARCCGEDWGCGPTIIQDSGDLHAGSFAYAMASQGDSVIITNLSQWSSAPGSAEVWRFDGSNWVLEAELSSDDPEPFDSFGASVAWSGDYAVIGAPWHGIGGAVYVFHRSGSRWVQEQKLVPAAELQDSAFGFAVAIEGDLIAIGDRNNDLAYVFHHDGPSWVEEQSLTPPEKGTTLFGRSVAVAQQSILVGAPYSSVQRALGGAVWVYGRDREQWSVTQTLVPDDQQELDSFGTTIAAHEGVVLIAAIENSGNGPTSGAVYAFHNASGVWAQHQKLVPHPTVTNLNFGWCMSISDTTLVIGCLYNFHNPDFRGTAVVYQRNGETWIPIQSLVSPEPSTFGFSVASTSAGVIIGRPKLEQAGGSARVFTNCPFEDCNGNLIADSCDIAAGTSIDTNRDGVPDECQITACPPYLGLQGMGVGTLDLFGQPVAAADGAILVGAPKDTVGNVERAGSAHLYRRIGPQWTEIQMFTASVPTEHDWFGATLTLTGELVVIGARGDDEAGVDVGAAYVYREAGEQYQPESKLLPFDRQEFAEFGTFVAADGDVVAVSAPGDYGSGDHTGAAYLFRFNGQWTLEQKLTAPDGLAAKMFGRSIALSGNRLLVAATHPEGGLAHTGRAYVYEYDGTQWVYKQLLTSATVNVPYSGAYPGVNTALDADKALLAAWGGTGSSDARMYLHDGTAFVHIQTLPTTPGPYAPIVGDQAVIRGDTAIVSSGSPARVYQFSGAQWLHAHDLKLPEVHGPPAAITSIGFDGETAVLGASGIPEFDAYVISGVPFIDCNGNGLPDSCDLQLELSQDSNSNGIPDECECAADISPRTGDGTIDLGDLLSVVNSWGPCLGCVQDLNSDGVVNAADLLIVINSWGPCP